MKKDITTKDKFIVGSALAEHLRLLNASNSAKAEATKSSIAEEHLKFSYNIIDMHTIDCEKFLRLIWLSK